MPRAPSELCPTTVRVAGAAAAPAEVHRVATARIESATHAVRTRGAPAVSFTGRRRSQRSASRHFAMDAGTTQLARSTRGRPRRLGRECLGMGREWLKSSSWLLLIEKRAYCEGVVEV